MLENIVLPGIHKERFPKRQLLAIWALEKEVINELSRKTWRIQLIFQII